MQRSKRFASPPNLPVPIIPRLPLNSPWRSPMRLRLAPPISGVLMLAACSTAPQASAPISLPPIALPTPIPPAELLETVPPPLRLPGNATDPVTPIQLFEGYGNLAEYDHNLPGM